MIIKSLSRATKSFEALYNYLARDKESLLKTFNLYANAYSKKEVVKEFLDNAKYLKRAKGKNYLYHEIISLQSNNLSLKEQELILDDIVSKYISLRAENHLVFTALHKDKAHLHIHLMISANELEGAKRVRLSKKEFSTIQKELENYTNSIYPQLGTTKHYNRDLKEIKSKKELLKSSLEDLFKNSTSKEDFIKRAKELNLEFYTRGKTVGVISKGKKHRLKTLGVLEDYTKTVERLEKEANKEDISKEEKVASNQNEVKIKSRREQMRELRKSKYKEAKEKR